ncbi:MAG: hypothetical protein HGB12_03250, partial [Bacteroidetes bacterium]|nr:hypothetical protein [Bacteroidota bacterium]
MKKSINTFYFSAIVITCLFFSSCAKDTLNDAEKLAALKNVTFTYNNISFVITIPTGALSSGKTFNELLTEDSAKYANPANYSIDFIVNMNADNTKKNAEDAKFDGMTVNVIMDTIVSYPVSTVVHSFEILKNTAQQVNAEGGINLKTHRLTGLYIFKQVVAGEDLAATLSTMLNYNFGGLSGVINLPDVHQQIPTSAS